MATIKFVKNHPPIAVDAGDNLMRSLLRAGLPVASSCNGQGICSKCRVRIVSGNENLSAERAHEKDLRRRNSVADDYRISCQCSIKGDVTVDTNYW